MAGRAGGQLAGARNARLPGGHLGQRHIGLYRVVFVVPNNAARPLIKLPGRQGAAQYGVKTAVYGRTRVGGFEGALAQAGQGLFHGGALAAPPGGQSGQLQCLAQQVVGQRGQKAQQRGRLQKGRPRRIGHQHIAGANGLQQSGHTQRRVRAQFQRVKVLVVHAFEQAVNGHQALEGLEVQVLVTHDQVTALDQTQAQVTRQVGVLKIGLVVRAGCQQRQMRVDARRAHVFQAVHERAVGAGQPLHPHGLKSLGELAGDGQAVFQQITQTRRRLAALADHPPVAVRAAGQVKSSNVQTNAAHWFDAVHGPQVTRVTLHQRGRQQAFFKQLLRAVNVGHDLFQQAHALHDTGFNF